MLDYLRSLPIGVWAGLVIVGLGIWSLSIFGVALGGILAIVTLIATDRAQENAESADDEDVSGDARFKDL